MLGLPLGVEFGFLASFLHIHKKIMVQIHSKEINVSASPRRSSLSHVFIPWWNTGTRVSCITLHVLSVMSAQVTNNEPNIVTLYVLSVEALGCHLNCWEISIHGKIFLTQTPFKLVFQYHFLSPRVQIGWYSPSLIWNGVDAQSCPKTFLNAAWGPGWFRIFKMPQSKSGLYLGYFDFFSKLFSKLEFKKFPVQVHIIPNFKSFVNFKSNLGCIWVSLIFSLNRFPNENLRNTQFRYIPPLTLNQLKVSKQIWAALGLFWFYLQISFQIGI